MEIENDKQARRGDRHLNPQTVRFLGPNLSLLLSYLKPSHLPPLPSFPSAGLLGGAADVAAIDRRGAQIRIHCSGGTAGWVHHVKCRVAQIVPFGHHRKSDYMPCEGQSASITWGMVSTRIHALVVGWQCDFNRSWSAHVSHVEPQKRFKTALAHDAIMDLDHPRPFYVGQERFTQGMSNQYFLDPSLWESGFSFETALQEAAFWKRWYV